MEDDSLVRARSQAQKCYNRVIYEWPKEAFKRDSYAITQLATQQLMLAAEMNTTRHKDNATAAEHAAKKRQYLDKATEMLRNVLVRGNRRAVHKLPHLDCSTTHTPILCRPHHLP